MEEPNSWMVCNGNSGGTFYLQWMIWRYPHDLGDLHMYPDI